MFSALAAGAGWMSPTSTVAEPAWPEFRGPAAQGISAEKDLPVEWGPEKNVVWKTDVAGIGWSSPVSDGKRIYLTTAVASNGNDEDPKADRSLRSLALDAATGKPLWDIEVFFAKAADSPGIHKKNSHASPTPILENGRLYVHYGHQGTACLDAETGSILWSTREHAYKPVHGAGGSPVISDDLLIFNCDAAENPFVLALDKVTGKQRWKYERVTDAKRKFSFCTPLLIDVNGRRQLISPGSGAVCALDPKDGKEIWRARYGEGYSVVPRPVYSNGMIFLGTGYDKPSALAIKVDGEGDVTDTHIAWTQMKFAPHNPSMVVVGDEVYMVADNGVMSCLNAKTGEAYYQERATGPISASLLYANGRIYAQDEKGVGIVVAAGKEFKVLATNDLAERSLASYAVLDSDLLIRTQGHLYRIGKR